MRRKVLWLIKGLGPGGAERLLLSHARVADHERFEHHVAYVVPAKDRLVPALRREGVLVHPIGDAGPRTWPLALLRLLRQERFDVVHLHSPLLAGVARLLVRSLPRAQRPLLVSTEHNTWWSYARPTRVLNALQHRGDDVRLAVSQDVHESMAPAQRAGVEVLVHGIVLEDVAAAAAAREGLRAELGIAPDEVVIGTIANYRHQKAYPDLLRAAAQVLQRQPRARFLAVGQGPLEDEVERLHRELGLGDRFLLLGYREDVLEVLSACDAFTLSSLHEGFPVALMEALATGLPCVVTRVGGMPDAVHEEVEGLLVEPGDVNGLARAYERVVTDDDLRRRCGAAARDAARQFDVRRAVQRLEDVYASAAG